MIGRLLREVNLPEDHVPASVLSATGLPDLHSALCELHVPSPDADLTALNAFRTPAQTRLIFEEFFWLECGLELKKTKARTAVGIPFELTAGVREQIKTMLPFKPTGAQRKRDAGNRG